MENPETEGEEKEEEEEGVEHEGDRRYSHPGVHPGGLTPDRHINTSSDIKGALKCCTLHSTFVFAAVKTV